MGALLFYTHILQALNASYSIYSWHIASHSHLHCFLPADYHVSKGNYYKPKHFIRCTMSTVGTALRPKSPLSAEIVLIEWDLWAPCNKQQAEARESQPSRSNDTTLLSAMCCQHEGCYPDLFWLVSINLWETKWGETAEDSLVYTYVQNGLTTVLYDMLYLFSSCPDRSLTSSF